MTEEHKDDWLDAMMRDEAYIEDAGFTARVMEQLPPPAPIRRRRRYAVLLGSTVLGSLLSLFVLPGGEVITDAFTEALRVGLGDAQGLSMVTVAVLGLFAVGTAAVLRASEG